MAFPAVDFLVARGAALCTVIVLAVIGVYNVVGFDPRQGSFTTHESAEPFSLRADTSENDQAECQHGIIMPIYPPHFDVGVRFLQSFRDNVIDHDIVDIFVICSNAQEQAEFRQLMSQHLHAALPRVQVWTLQKVLVDCGIPQDQAELVKPGQRKFTYQSVKKYYGMVASNCSRALLLDAEAVVVKPMSFREAFSDYFTNPFMIVSHTGGNGVMRRIMDESLFMLGRSVLEIPNNAYNFEYQGWFLERHILLDMFATIEQVHGVPVYQALRKKDFPFEMSIYLWFIFFHLDSYPEYTVFDMDMLASSFFGQEYKNWLALRPNTMGAAEGLLCNLSPVHYPKLLRMCNFLKWRFARPPPYTGMSDLQARLFAEVPTLTIQVCDDRDSRPVLNPLNLTLTSYVERLLSAGT